MQIFESNSSHDDIAHETAAQLPLTGFPRRLLA